MRGRILIVVAVLATVLGADVASAAQREITKRSDEIAVAPYSVRYGATDIEAPKVDGTIVRMHARVVDRKGRQLPVRTVMLHHIVFLNKGSKAKPKVDRTYCDNARGQRFYGTGEDDEIFAPPAGYGYPIEKEDGWYIGWMLMNHQGKVTEAFIEYTITVDSDPSLTPVTPYWAGVVPCSADPIYTVPGTGGPGSKHSLAKAWTVPQDGRIVYASAHLHGGATALQVGQPGCQGRTLIESRPWYGLDDHPFYNVLPVLHEPGPVTATTYSSPTGQLVRKGDRLSIRSVYDNERLHSRVMGIMHLYLAPPRPGDEQLDPCSPRPEDVSIDLQPIPGRPDPPRFTVPTTGLKKGRAVRISRPPGPVKRLAKPGRAIVDIFGYRFDKTNLEVPAGSRVTWRFNERLRHDITVVDGPVGFASSQRARRGTYTQRLDAPGTYRLQCTLHPIAMTQRIDVVPRKG